MSASTSDDPDLGFQVTTITFTVDLLLKGSLTDRMTFRQGCFQPESQPTLLGLPRFDEGEEAVLFLWDEEPSGLTTTVGLGQGKFTVILDELGRRTVRNSRRNQGLFSGFSPQARQRVGDALYASTQGERLLLEELLDLIRALARRGGGRHLTRPTLALV